MCVGRVCVCVLFTHAVLISRGSRGPCSDKYTLVVPGLLIPSIKDPSAVATSTLTMAPTLPLHRAVGLLLLLALSSVVSDLLTPLKMGRIPFFGGNYLESVISHRALV